MGSNGHWRVPLNGWNDVFEAVRCPPEWDFLNEDGNHVLSSSKFSSLSDAGAVRDKAKQILNRINGAALIQTGTRQLLSIGSVEHIHEDGSRTVTRSIRTAAILSEEAVGIPTIIGGTPVPTITPISEILARVSFPDVELVLSFLVYPAGEPKWTFNLWKAFELIRGGRDNKPLTSHGWTTDDEIKRFSTTVNDPRVSGDAARHAQHSHPSHPSPMSQREAERFVLNLFEQWVREKDSHSKK